ncbi:MAG: hypothetical protein ABR519_08520 [Bacteroidales bacterium]
MKKFALLTILAFAFVMIMSACNREVCPAYTMADSGTEFVG